MASYCAQILWMKQTLEDYGLKSDHILINCDDTIKISLSKNPIQHSSAKYIEVRHYFLRDHIVRIDVILEFIGKKHQLIDIFTKPLTKDHFCKIRRNLVFIYVKDI
jgi:hypothetical protein